MYVYRIRSRYCSVHRYWRWPGHQLCHRKGCDAIARQPEAADKIQSSLLIGCALAEATAVYGLVIGIMLILFS